MSAERTMDQDQDQDQDTAQDGRRLLDAGAVLPLGTVSGTGGPDSAADVLTARGYRHPVLDDRLVVRLVPGLLGGAEDAALEFLGLTADAPPVEVGQVRREALGFPAWALVNDPANGHHALAVVKEMERPSRQVAAKPKAAKEGFEELADRLGRAVPHFLPTYCEQVARIFLAQGNQAYAGTWFGRAREAERTFGLEIDEERLRAVFLEFALAGALTVKALRQYVKDLAARLGGPTAWQRFRRLCAERSAAGMAPYAGLAEDARTLIRAAGLDQAQEEQSLLAELIAAPAIGRAPGAFWKASRSALTGLARREETVRLRLLEILPAAADHAFDEVWLHLLAESGAEELLTDPRVRLDEPAARWLERWTAHLNRGWQTRLVEAPAPGSTPEAVRRAALLVGWALRADAERSGGVDPVDLRREEWMRERIRQAGADGRRVAAVVGAFHAPALLQPEPHYGPGPEYGPGPGAPGDGHPTHSGPAAGRTPTAGRPDLAPTGPSHPALSGSGRAAPSGPVPGEAPEVAPGSHVVSLIPYTYPLLDSRSGYPAGIRDPEWQHTVLAAGGDPDSLAEAVIGTAVRICERLRAEGHPAGPADAREIVRLAGDLARLRGLPAPGRGELAEAVRTVLAQGEPLGRGRAVARALEQVLVGTRTGRPTPAAPRGGLGPAVEAQLAELGLPGPADSADAAPRDLRLDPLRSPLDARRALLLSRLEVCGVPYGERVATGGAGGTEAIGSRWRVRWTPAVQAMLAVAGSRGVTAAQAAEGTLGERLRRERAADGPTARQVIDGLADAAGCGLAALTAVRLDQLAEVLPATGSLPELLAGLALVDRLAAGHFPTEATGPARPDAAAPTAALLTTAAVARLDGLAGSDDPADAHALLEFARRAHGEGGLRLGHTLRELADRGSPLVRGAAGAVLVLLGERPAGELGGRVASWVDGATDADRRHTLVRALTGLLTAAEGLLDSAPDALAPLLERVAALPDTAFLDRLPALRGGFDALSPAARDRLLTLVEEQLGEHVDTLPAARPPAVLGAWARADLAARQALAAKGLLPTADLRPADLPPADCPPVGGSGAPGAGGPRVQAPAPDDVPAGPSHRLAAADRWRLLLGRPGSRRPSGPAGRLATALDELYGHGRGEGAGLDLGPGGRGGREAPYPGVREWSEELAALFGPGIREEVLAAAAAHGRSDVLASLDPAAVRPSVDLLRTVLEHAGGLSESRLAALRPLVRRLVEELTRELAQTLRPALTGLTVPRPSRRPGGVLDLDRTIRANLTTARPGPDGGTLVVPERPVFRSRAARSADWRLILVVDVSGSMEPSTIWAAMTAAILAGVPSLTTHFVAFSTEVADLSGRVADPLGLLLEVRVGGGTHIAAGLAYARELVTVPSRTLIAVISDFEEGHPVGGLLAQTRALVGEGCHLLGCAALDDTGRARYSKAVAGQLVAAGMPVAALSPLELARWVGEKIA